MALLAPAQLRFQLGLLAESGIQDATWAQKEAAWSAARAAAYAAWDDIKIVREDETLSLLGAYHAEIIHLVDGAEVDATLPDSFAVGVRVSGKG